MSSAFRGQKGEIVNKKVLSEFHATNPFTFTFTSYAPINVKPQGGEGGRADPGEFDILMAARVKFPTPGHLLN